jgi:2-keto-4-pentenoate hydratase/2-oxohepta-3-ene-1,7-dioic acid hydratase in catechol pathway
MKLVTFETGTPVGKLRRLGALLKDDEAGGIVDLTAAFTKYLAAETDEPTPREYAALRTPPDMIGWLRAGREGRNAAEKALAYVRSHPDADGLDGAQLIYDRKDIKLLAPVPRPPSFRDCNGYFDHMSRAQRPIDEKPRNAPKTEAWYRYPVYYKGSCTAIAGPDDPAPWPYYTEFLDLELELGIIVGKEGRNLTVEQAEQHIAGYTILVDSSCRDGQEREPFGPNKRKDFHTALGPWLVTADEVQPEALACSLEVDGEVWYEGNTGAPHIFSPAQLVAYLSDSETIYPGDLIGTGTIADSCSMDTHRWIKIGQTARFTMAGLGSISLKVVAGEHVVSHVRGMTGQIAPPAGGR